MTQQGDLRWGVKESFVHYVLKIATGTIHFSGGAQKASEGDFIWPLTRAARASGLLELSFAGSIQFVAHGGFLDVDLREPILRLTGTGGSLSFLDAKDGHSKAVAVFNEPDISSGQDIESESAQAAKEKGGLVPELTKYGAELFGGVYPEGTAFDALAARISVPNG